MDGCSRLSGPRTGELSQEARPAAGQTAADRPEIWPPARTPPSGSHLPYGITRFQSRGSEARGPCTRDRRYTARSDSLEDRSRMPPLNQPQMSKPRQFETQVRMKKNIKR